MNDSAWVEHADLTAANTLRLPSRAQHAVFARSVDSVRAAVESCLRRSLPVTIIGGGSNVVLQRRVAGCVIVPRLKYMRTEDLGDRMRVRVGAGTAWQDLVRFALGQGLRGIENLALIPGSVGGAPVQNIGAYGVELESVLETVSAVSLVSADRVEFTNAACRLGYRDSIFRRAEPPEYVIVEVVLSLPRVGTTNVAYPDVATELARMGRTGERPTDVADAVVRVRRRKLPDPRRVPNAGSFFKNPVVDTHRLDAIRARIDGIQAFATGIPGEFKVPAARLIDACGFKVRPAERVAVWPRQALVLINRGGADATDVLDFASTIADEVDARFGIALELEPRVLGER